MSHFNDIQTAITDRDGLVRALLRCGFQKNMIEIHDTPQNLFGYQGDVRKQKAHVIIRRKYIGSSSNDVGYELVNGQFVAHISEFDSGTGTYSSNHSNARCNQAWQTKLATYYGVEKAKIEFEKKKIRYEEDVDEKERPRLRAFIS
jgi:hypothetical protein